MTIETSKGEYAQLVATPTVNTAVAISGQKTVTTAGTAVQGANVPLDNGVFIAGLSSNTGKVYVGNDGEDDVSATTGYELGAGESVLIHVANLNELWFDAAVNGEGICWIKA